MSVLGGEARVMEVFHGSVTVVLNKRCARRGKLRQAASRKHSAPTREIPFGALLRLTAYRRVEVTVMRILADFTN